MVRDDRRRRDRRRQKRKKYGQTQIKHSKRGIISCVFAGIAMVLDIVMIVVAYNSGGKAASYIGGLGVVATILCGMGIYMAIRGLKERNKQKVTCKVGALVNGILLVGFVGIFCRGLF